MSEDQTNLSLVSKLRENPWMVSTFVLALLFVGSLVFGFSPGLSGNVVSEKEAGQRTVEFLQQKVSGEVVLNSVVKENGFYKLDLTYQGQEVPVYVTMDGKNLIADFVPLDGSESPSEGSSSAETESSVDSIDLSNSPVRGEDDAPVTIVEFSDYECPFCGSFYDQALPLIEQNYISTGKAKLVYKDFPLNFHPMAEPAARALRCVGEKGGDEAYWQMHDKVFSNQASLSEDNLKVWAKDLGYDINDCLDSGKYANEIQAEVLYGQNLGVSGTPSFFIGNEETGYVQITGAQPYTVFEQIIESKLA